LVSNLATFCSCCCGDTTEAAGIRKEQRNKQKREGKRRENVSAYTTMVAQVGDMIA